MGFLNEPRSYSKNLSEQSVSRALGFTVQVSLRVLTRPTEIEEPLDQRPWFIPLLLEGKPRYLCGESPRKESITQNASSKTNLPRTRNFQVRVREQVISRALGRVTLLRYFYLYLAGPPTRT